MVDKRRLAGGNNSLPAKERRLPKFDAATVQKLISEGRIGALSLDTQVLRGQSYNLSSPTTLALKQFSGTSIALVLSDVVVGEIREHLTQSAMEAWEKLTSVLKEMKRKHYQTVDGPAILHTISEQPVDVADRIITQLKTDFGFHVHATKGDLDMPELLRRYFEAAPPFEARADKKSEFPDAIALMSLSAWASKSDTTIIVVSKDVGWRLFADESSNLICVDDIATALDLFNKENHFIAERIVSLVQTGEAKQLVAEITSCLERYIEALESPDYDVWTTMDAEMDFVEVDLADWTVDDTLRLRVLDANDKDISFVFEVEVVMAVTGHFDFSVSDKEDTMPMGSAEIATSHRQTVPISISVDKSTLPDPEVHSVEVGPMRGRFLVRFGDIEPEGFYQSDEHGDPDDSETA